MSALPAEAVFLLLRRSCGRHGRNDCKDRRRFGTARILRPRLDPPGALPGVQVPHLALRVTGAPRTIDELAHATVAVLRHGGFDAGACFVGHSYGTFAVSRLRQLHPEVGVRRGHRALLQ